MPYNSNRTSFQICHKWSISCRVLYIKVNITAPWMSWRWLKTALSNATLWSLYALVLAYEVGSNCSSNWPLKIIILPLKYVWFPFKSIFSCICAAFSAWMLFLVRSERSCVCASLDLYLCEFTPDLSRWCFRLLSGGCLSSAVILQFDCTVWDVDTVTGRQIVWTELVASGCFAEEKKLSCF